MSHVIHLELSSIWLLPSKDLKDMSRMTLSVHLYYNTLKYGSPKRKSLNQMCLSAQYNKVKYQEKDQIDMVALSRNQISGIISSGWC